jgi:hypothetical protein
MKKTFLLFLIITGTRLIGQTIDFRTYYLTDSINVLAKDSNNYKHRIAEELSYIGEYQYATTTYDESGDFIVPYLSSKDSLYFLQCKPVNALNYISKIAEKEQIIIINEAHRQPYHRVFTTLLLKELYAKGYRYFGGETINEWDTLINYRKYPTQNSGCYTKDPLYSEMVRTALEIGFTVFGYESTIYDTTTKTDKSVSIREMEQAKNIKKILDKDPNAKILIHCGYDHLVETPYRGWGKAMAGRLTEYTGINPFTIDQVELTEHSSLNYENPIFKMINLDYYAVFMDSTGNLFNGSQGSKRYDVCLYHPRTKWVNGRPNWVFENNRNPYFVNRQITIEFPCLVLAYKFNEKFSKTNENDNPIPFDIVELKSKDDLKALSLEKGKYAVIIRNRSGNTQELQVTE